MGATSVTGVGHGSAEGANKGNEHTSLGVGRLIGPRIVAAGRATLATNVASVEVPVPTATATDYIVLATSVNASTANAVAVTSFAVNATTKVATIGLKGAGASDVVNWAIVKTGLA
jgi:hypothetical protein